jgi:hypothetical protein
MQGKYIDNTFNKIIAEKFTNIERNFICLLRWKKFQNIKQTKSQKKNFISIYDRKDTRCSEQRKYIKSSIKQQVLHKVKSIRITADFSIDPIKVQKTRNYIFHTLKTKRQSRLLYPIKLSFIIEREI